MSMSFDIFPTNRYVPKTEEIKRMSQKMLNNYLLKAGIDFNISLNCKKRVIETNSEVNSDYIITTEKEYQVFNINNQGEALVFFHKVTEIDREFWKEEMILNEKADQFKDQIDMNLKIGYMWNVKRTMNQPAIISIYYGFLAMSIAILTEGIVYSDDGGWEYDSFPMTAEQFKDEYLDLSKAQDKILKEFVRNSLHSLKQKKANLQDRISY